MSYMSRDEFTKEFTKDMQETEPQATVASADDYCSAAAVPGEQTSLEPMTGQHHSELCDDGRHQLQARQDVQPTAKKFEAPFVKDVNFDSDVVM